IDESRVADAVQDEAAGVREQHHAARSADLLVKMLHDAAGMAEQFGVALARHHEVAARGVGWPAALGILHAQALAALPGAQDRRGQAGSGQLSAVEELPPQRFDRWGALGPNRGLAHR